MYFHVQLCKAMNFVSIPTWVPQTSSTEHALLDIVGKIQKYVDEKLFSCGIFIALRKAFDTVDHDILLYKLHHYGIRGVINKRFCSYLTGRFQTTQIETKISKKETIACGVPQGSVLGPLLFLLYTNDISASSSKFEYFLFGDDINVLDKNKLLPLLESVVNEELTNVCDWLLANNPKCQKIQLCNISSLSTENSISYKSKIIWQWT